MSNSKQNPKNQSRRDFLRQSSCASLSTIGVVNTIANLRLMSAAMAAGPVLTDYKAMICLYMGGGNDSDNMLVPYDGPTRALYEAGRGVVAHPAEQLQRIYPDNTSTTFGLHPQLSDVAGMFNGRRLGIVTNVGSLLYPFANRDEFLNNTVPRPPNIFAHNTMTTHWMSSIPDQPFTSGWGGRITDLLHSSMNPSSSVTMGVSVAGLTNLLSGSGAGVGQLAVSQTNPVQNLSGFGTNYGSALSGTNYLNTTHGHRLKGLDSIHDQVRDHLMEGSRQSAFVDARENEATLTAAFAEAAATGLNFDSIFGEADSSLGDQLKVVAQMMAGRNCLGNNRQIFFVQVGGYDNHGSLLEGHDPLMEEFNNAPPRIR